MLKRLLLFAVLLTAITCAQSAPPPEVVYKAVPVRPSPAMTPAAPAQPTVQKATQAHQETPTHQATLPDASTRHAAAQLSDAAQSSVSAADAEASSAAECVEPSEPAAGAVRLPANLHAYPPGVPETAAHGQTQAPGCQSEEQAESRPPDEPEDGVLDPAQAMLLPIPEVTAPSAGPGAPTGENPAARKNCVLTFDDGPGPYTPELLDVLKQEGIKAVFFVLGQHVPRHEAVIRRMVAEGHMVGNHSYSHPRLTRLNRAAQYRQLARTQEMLARLGVKSTLFRPPYGARNATTNEVAASLGLSITLWDHDSRDWRDRRMEAAYVNLISRPLSPQATNVLLFHDSHLTTIRMIPQIIERLRAHGCVFVLPGEMQLAARSEHGAPTAKE